VAQHFTDWTQDRVVKLVTEKKPNAHVILFAASSMRTVSGEPMVLDHVDHVIAGGGLPGSIDIGHFDVDT
jgi:hypothetical protein